MYDIVYIRDFLLQMNHFTHNRSLRQLFLYM